MRYRAMFTETVTYSVEFDSDEELTESEAKDGDDTWSHEMDSESFSSGRHALEVERELLSLEKLPDEEEGE